jgi:hypothetical protein
MHELPDYTFKLERHRFIFNVLNLDSLDSINGS